ncbi:hypothetical protein GMORB2_4763 [Geosmithia morbida]|uniref:Uncharacterized protein n=1 Tax=Geosmithia morbida TaxID=1094350 RepID=A0A9P5D2F0_9HYPO|nr:uncharacterized protein GMORB2_4763 [Geosmithia morbida]KAF4119449.1 hypothetical protein GMORB2_4763 [Geosmithia morbida]
MYYIIVALPRLFMLDRAGRRRPPRNQSVGKDEVTHFAVWGT